MPVPGFRSRCSVVLVICAGAAAACGKKGPPLPPLVPIPAAVETITADRVGDDVFVSLTLPLANVDEHTPADLARVEVYGYTGRAQPPRARWVELSTLIASVPVAPPPPPAGEEPGPSRVTTPAPDAPVQGATITVRDTLTPDDLVQGRLPPAPPDRDGRPATRNGHQEPGTPNQNEEPGTRNREPAQPLRRFYVAVPFNARGRPGPPGGVAELPLAPVPDPPPSVAASYTERAVLVSWEPSGGLVGFLLDRPLPEELSPFLTDEESRESPAASAVAGPPAYHVYREIQPDALTAPRPERDAPWADEPPRPITAVPVTTLSFADAVEFGRRRCYTVRAVRGTGRDARVGPSSPPACLTPVDTYAPAPPQALAAVAAEGVVNLIWEPNAEPDLGGYIVLRGEAPGDTLHPLTDRPIPDPRHRDDRVAPGVRYVYAVVAVDNRLPLPNVSARSNRVEETAR